ncbi:MAG: copper amine oxidase N-terminal domain-containing protein [Candidatus Baltobacteraceae bacterium]
MKRLSTGVLAALIVAGFGLNAVAAQPGASHGNIGTNAIAQDQGATGAAPPANFGSPPSGQYPILFNDHHVYARPDILKKGRVLAALVRGGTILIPLRSMFEQMGNPTVSYDAASKTVTVSKPGAEIKVTVGKPEVVINGESRPLDVPPIIYQGTILVPVRVISEGMGAYVLWVPDRRIVVVRYIVATPPPPAPPPPPPPPTPTPTPVPKPYFVRYAAGDYIISPRVYNEFVPGSNSDNNNGGFSYRLHGAGEFPIGNIPFMVAVDYRQINWQHDAGWVTAIGGLFQTNVPAFNGRTFDFDARLGIRILNPHIYLAGAYMWRGNNYGYPNQEGAGVGLEALPNLEHAFSFYGSAYYFFGVNGNYLSTSGVVNSQFPNGSCTVAAPCNYRVGYDILKFDLGVVYSFPGQPFFVEAGFLGSRGWNQDAAPIGFSETGPYAGIGLKF